MTRRRNLLSWAIRTRSAHDRAQLPTAKGAKKSVEERMNKGEQRYAQLLDQRLAAGHVAGWWFEPLSWRMADNTHYRPDFLVLLADGTVEIHEVKGRKGDSFYAEEDAWLKCKVVAEQMPFPLVIVWQAVGGEWQERRL